MKIQYINKAADILYNSRINLKRIQSLPLQCNPSNKKEGYLIQDALINKYLLSKRNILVIGKKVGCTNKAAQDQINVNEPFYGNIISSYSAKSDCSLKTNNFFKPFIEPEFSFKIKKDIPIIDTPYSFEKICEYIELVLPSIEIVDSRFKDWTKVGINNLIADNAVNAFWIHGNETKKLNEYNFSNHKVNVYINNKIVEEGNSRNVLKNPINSITWLVNSLAKQGKYLSQNNYVSTGTCTPAIQVNKGDKVVADFGKLGKVEVNFI